MPWALVVDKVEVEGVVEEEDVEVGEEGVWVVASEACAEDAWVLVGGLC